MPAVVDHCGKHLAEDRIAFGLITTRALVDMLGRDWSEVRHYACAESIRDQIDDAALLADEIDALHRRWEEGPLCAHLSHSHSLAEFRKADVATEHERRDGWCGRLRISPLQRSRLTRADLPLRGGSPHLITGRRKPKSLLLFVTSAPNGQTAAWKDSARPYRGACTGSPSQRRLFRRPAWRPNTPVASIRPEVLRSVGFYVGFYVGCYDAQFFTRG